MDSYNDAPAQDEDMDDMDEDNIDNVRAEVNDDEPEERLTAPVRVTTPFLTKYERGMFTRVCTARYFAGCKRS